MSLVYLVELGQGDSTNRLDQVFIQWPRMVGGGGGRVGPHSEALRLCAAGQPADGNDSPKRNPTAATAHRSGPLNEQLIQSIA